jgi:polyhydroxybutyrate depolymerase
MKHASGRLGRLVRGPAVLIGVGLLLFNVGCANAASAAKETPVPKETTSSHAIKVGGVTRSWEQLSPGGAGRDVTPIIVVLSGRNATTSEEISRDRLMPLVNTGRAELVYPAGTGKSWNAGGCCGAAAKQNVNDVAFLQALVAQVDPGHSRPIYLVGYSNGGRMAYRMACTDPQLFNATAIVKAMPEPGCSVTQPVNFLQIDSTNDPHVAYQPGEPGMESPAATTEVARLRSTDGITQPARVVTRGSLQLQTWDNGKQGTRLAFATYHGGQHSWPAGDAATPSAGDVIWSFFSGAAAIRSGNVGSQH